ncbi:MAG: sigma-54 dependent transcriptional regulator [Pseudomonadota bacterium]
MSEAKILVIDADTQRSEILRSILQFIDWRSVLVSDASEIDLNKQSPQDWAAVVIGKFDNVESLKKFTEWFKRDHYHPPLLVLPEVYEQILQDFEFDRLACMALEFPFKYTQLHELLKRTQMQRKRINEVVKYLSDGPTGNSPVVKRLRRMIEQVAGFDTTVLVTGESGTGKEVVARAIHESSNRRDKPFVAVNCGAIPSELLESELFGHEKGAFTGAITTRKGRFEMADGGTLFLDEIGDMSLPMQVKILRALQERTYERVGSNHSVRCDVRVIAATHRNLEENIRKGNFREDLFYRLNVFPIETPPLRDRIDDLQLLIDDITVSMDRNGHGSVRFAPDAINALRQYPWPGNVRELHNLIERLAVLHPRGLVQAADLPQAYRRGVTSKVTSIMETVLPETLQAVADEESTVEDNVMPSPAVVAMPGFSQLPPDGVDLKDHIANIELNLIKQALRQANGVVAHAAKLLNTRRTTLVEKLRKYGLQREDSSDLNVDDLMQDVTELREAISA